MKKKIKFYNRLPKTSFKKRYFEGGCRLKSKLIKKPLITLITVTFNSEKYLSKTIKSINDQKFKNFEYIIVDGGSTDKTIKIIKKNEKKIDYWVSENDEGIYDAFNKGLSLSKGKYIGFVNSDDVLKKNALVYLNKYINKYSYLDFFFGSVKKHWGLLHGFKPWKIYFSWGFYTSHSTGFYIKRESAKKLGFYDTQFKYSSDFDYFYRMIVKHKMKGMASKKNEVFGVFRRGGFSSKVNFLDHLIEDSNIRIKNGQNKILVGMILIYKVIKNINRLK